MRYSAWGFFILVYKYPLLADFCINDILKDIILYAKNQSLEAHAFYQSKALNIFILFHVENQYSALCLQFLNILSQYNVWNMNTSTFTLTYYTTYIFSISIYIPYYILTYIQTYNPVYTSIYILTYIPIYILIYTPTYILLYTCISQSTP